jgi:hypothetical protein
LIHPIKFIKKNVELKRESPDEYDNVMKDLDESKINYKNHSKILFGKKFMNNKLIQFNIRIKIWD